MPQPAYTTAAVPSGIQEIQPQHMQQQVQLQAAQPLQLQPHPHHPMQAFANSTVVAQAPTTAYAKQAEALSPYAQQGGSEAAAAAAAKGIDNNPVATMAAPAST